MKRFVKFLCDIFTCSYNLQGLYCSCSETLKHSKHKPFSPLQWRHNGLDSVSNHQPHHCLLSRLFGRRSKKTSKLRVTGLCAGNSPGTGQFPTQMASYAENVSIDDVIMAIVGTNWRCLHEAHLYWASLCGLNSLRLSVAIWSQGTCSILVQIMAWCHPAPSHYLNQYWLIISEVWWHLPQGNFSWNVQDRYSWYEFEYYYLRLKSRSPEGNELNTRQKLQLIEMVIKSSLVKYNDKGTGGGGGGGGCL